jgi:hypothetical protein
VLSLCLSEEGQLKMTGCDREDDIEKRHGIKKGKLGGPEAIALYLGR